MEGLSVNATPKAEEVAAPQAVHPQDRRQTKARTCEWCDGTGSWWLLRSWFTADGARRESCHVCRGTGSSEYRADADWKRMQRRLRDLRPADQKPKARKVK